MSSFVPCDNPLGSYEDPKLAIFLFFLSDFSKNKPLWILISLQPMKILPCGTEPRKDLRLIFSMRLCSPLWIQQWGNVMALLLTPFHKSAWKFQVSNFLKMWNNIQCGLLGRTGHGEERPGGAQRPLTQLCITSGVSAIILLPNRHLSCPFSMIHMTYRWYWTVARVGTRWGYGNKRTASSEQASWIAI